MTTTPTPSSAPSSSNSRTILLLVIATAAVLGLGVALYMVINSVRATAIAEGYARGVAEGQVRGEKEGFEKGVAAEKIRVLDAEKAAASAKVAAIEAARLAEEAKKAKEEAERKSAEEARLAALKAEEERLDKLFPYRRVAVLAVGINYVGTPHRNLKFAERDASSTAALLEKVYRFSKPNVLIGPDATRARIVATLEDSLSKLGPDDDFVFYFAGHGATLQESKTMRIGVLLPHDGLATGEIAAQRAAAIEILWVIDRLRTAQREKHGRHLLVVLDSCFSGLPPLSIPVSPVQSEFPLQQSSIQLLTAGAANERAVELTSIGAGVFSHELRTALSSESASTQSVLRLFLNVQEAVIRNPDYLKSLGGRPAMPEHRSYLATTGNFYFIARKGYDAWKNSQEIGRKIEGFDRSSAPVIELDGIQDSDLQDVTDAELRAFLGKVPKSGDPLKTLGQFAGALDPNAAPASGTSSIPVVLATPAEIKRFKIRASLGDAEAMSIMSVILGESADTTQKSSAAEYARGAFETGAESGQFALGMALSQGYGMDKDAELGAQLIGRSNYGDAISWVRDLLLLGGGAAAVKSDDKGTKAVGFGLLVAGAKGMFDRARNSIQRNAAFDAALVRFRTTRNLLGSPATEIAAAVAELDKIKTEVDAVKEKDLPSELRVNLLAAVVSIREKCTPETRTEALLRAHQWLDKAEKK